MPHCSQLNHSLFTSYYLTDIWHFSYFSHSCYMSILSPFFILIAVTQLSARRVPDHPPPRTRLPSNWLTIPPTGYYTISEAINQQFIQFSLPTVEQSNRSLLWRYAVDLWGCGVYLRMVPATTKGRYWKQNVIRPKTNECKCRSAAHSLTQRGQPQRTGSHSARKLSCCSTWYRCFKHRYNYVEFKGN